MRKFEYFNIDYTSFFWKHFLNHAQIRDTKADHRSKSESKNNN